MVGVEDMTLVGGVAGVSQALDGIRWKNVNFVNIHIRYEGAEVLLSNVRFVNCTFDIVNDHRGELVTDYAILSVPKSLVISQSVASSFIPQLDQRFPQPVLLPKPEAMPFGTLRASTQSGSEETPK
jgi:hypothetical protein